MFFTSDKKPETLIRLRSYVLHRSFGRLVSSSSTAAVASTTGGNTGTMTTTSNVRLFQFPYKANVVDRDEVLVPMGWDSWGKIKILRDGFDPLVVGNGWLFDLEKPSRRLFVKSSNQPPAANETLSSNDDDQVGYDSEGRKIVSACKLWEDMIGETDDDIPLINPHDRVNVTEEQQFLRTKYEVIKKERDLDPRSHFQLNTKGHSAQQALRFANGSSLPSSDNNGLNLNGGAAAGLASTGAEEEMNAQLNKFSLRDPQGISNGRNSNPSLSPVEILHLQQQQQLNQTPRNSYAPSSTVHSLAAGASKTMMTNQKMANSITSPLASRFNPSSSSSVHPHLSHQPSMLINLNNPNHPGTPGSTPAEKAMLANFFGKLLDKDSSGARGLTTTINPNHPVSQPTSSTSTTSHHFFKPSSIAQSPSTPQRRRSSNSSHSSLNDPDRVDPST